MTSRTATGAFAEHSRIYENILWRIVTAHRGGGLDRKGVRYFLGRQPHAEENRSYRQRQELYHEFLDTPDHRFRSVDLEFDGAVFIGAGVDLRTCLEQRQHFSFLLG